MAGDTVITVVGNLTADPELRWTQAGRRARGASASLDSLRRVAHGVVPQQGAAAIYQLTKVAIKEVA